MVSDSSIFSLGRRTVSKKSRIVIDPEWHSIICQGSRGLLREYFTTVVLKKTIAVRHRLAKRSKFKK